MGKELGRGPLLMHRERSARIKRFLETRLCMHRFLPSLGKRPCSVQIPLGVESASLIHAERVGATSRRAQSH
jgi:hypothetical protein